MLHRTASQTPRDTDVHAGCWSGLLPFLRRERKGTDVPDTKPTKELGCDYDCRELVCLLMQLRTSRAEGVVQPPYNHWYGGDEWDQVSSASAYVSSEKPPRYTVDDGLPSGVVDVIEYRLKELSPELRQLSLDIWSTHA